ncbi:peroxiredoxin family protein, partial [Haloferula sp.]|uniref:peroxiredoxin family protein n=1 Tax=Haloferula sp. TaxID=2497595 RepID=UPI003C77F3FB
MKNICVLLLMLFSSAIVQGQQPRGGILNQQAPEWEVDKWLNLPEGKDTLTLADYKGKVVFLCFFQSWCPACIGKGLPDLKDLQTKYKNNEDVALVAVQTVFEGHDTNTMEAAEKIAKKFKLKMPIGQSGEKGKRSAIKKNYKAPGTPWSIIIGKDGKV